MKNNKIEFLYKSIEDSQSIIRAIDVKAGFLFAINLLPITGLDKIIAKSEELYCYTPFALAFILIILIAWLISLYSLFKTVASISNPAEKVDKSGIKVTGVFYMNLLSGFNLTSCLSNTLEKSRFSLNEKINSLPDDDDKLIEELVFEKIKTSYIRDIKIQRLSLCFKMTFLWIILGVVCWSFLLLKG